MPLIKCVILRNERIEMERLYSGENILSQAPYFYSPSKQSEAHSQPWF